MVDEVNIINVDRKNIEDHPATCFLNPKHEGYQIKKSWIQKRFSEGLKIKLLYVGNEIKSNGFIEYIPGENAWRAVSAKDHMFIHCIWISPNKYKEKGYASLLVNEVIKDAKKEKMKGVCTVTSEGPFMAGADLYQKNGFKSVETAEPSFNLMVKTFKKGALPKFNDWETKLKKYKGLNIIYSNQCPWIARAIPELTVLAKKKGLKLKLTELKTAKQAQEAPSVYSSFNLIYNGKLLADHYISTKRFENIIKKEL